VSKFKSKDFEQKAAVPCAHEGCPHPAILSRKLKTGWANLCKKHDLFHVQQEDDEFCRQNGLTTRVAQIAFIREKLGSSRLFSNVLESTKLFRNVMTRIREPGEEG
jgi:hypothetical protein